MRAGQRIDLIGGIRPAENRTRWTVRTITRAEASCLRFVACADMADDSRINLHGPGRIDILAPAHTHEILHRAGCRPPMADCPSDVTLQVWMDKTDRQVTGEVTISAAVTSDNNSN